jgi:hypothetical protein
MKDESLYKVSRLMGNSPEICRRHYAAQAPNALQTSVEFCIEICSIATATHANPTFKNKLSRATDIFGL